MTISGNSTSRTIDCASPKRVGDEEASIIWQSYERFLNHNVFSWLPEYQLFGSEVFHPGEKARQSTESVSLKTGEQCILDEDGILGQPSSGGPQNALTLVNRYGSIFPGIHQASTGIHGEATMAPIYVAPEALLKGSKHLIPADEILIWFEQHIEASTMIHGDIARSGAQSYRVSIDLSDSDVQSRLYQDQEWSIPRQG